uniref:DNA-directed RNA polymerase subunit beta' n=1 Tax=Nageia nagi TaxID=36012 RepID=G3XH87_9CONI|nr:RNA polymerase beta subunit-1 [Nageia nagi]BAK86687.1 RNA polymerase beta subunit-1 [Nageia nagi]BAO19786.1 RNA polymerase beta subunit-1 [Nageia nagi]BCK60641.1 RNA polymerase beta subunit-1 [Nageia nagi]
MINQNKHRQLQIGLASPEQIRAWSERILPNGERVGEVTNPYAFDIETNQPERDGLFCERIFGPKKTGVCACGKPKVIENEEGSQFCKHCGVELVDSRIRRYRMGYIKLACPVVHIWYFKRRPSYIANLLDLTRKDLEGLVYCDSCITRAVANKPTLLRVGSGPFQYQDQYWTDIIHKYITWRDLRKFLEREITTGGNAIREKLAGLDLQIILDRSSMEWVTLDAILKTQNVFDGLPEEGVPEEEENLELLIEKQIERQIDAEIEREWEKWEKKNLKQEVPEEEESLESHIKKIWEKEGTEEKDLFEEDLLYEEEVPDWEEYMIRRRKDFLVRRMKLTKHFIQTNIQPEWMVLCLLPVLPPEPRPMFQLDEGDIITSDINELYRKLILRNRTLTKFLAKLFTPLPDSVNGQKRLIQEAVDALLDNGIGGQPVTDRHDRPYKSFSDLIQGKEGRFRENLLGKRVDYSGRSVIVVGPFLSLYQCGLPLEIAVELFQAFLIRSLIERHIAPNLRAAKSLIRDRAPIIWSVLKEVLRGYPLLLNRAPTLHRLGIQAFQPILIEGRAIRLHPLVCAGFNADFDGDQMAVHVPLSLEAQAEARLLMFSHINLLSPATGDSLCVPTQDMLLGLYRSTLENNQGIYENKSHPYNSKNKIISPSFSSYEDALGAYQHKRIDLDSPLWLRWGRVPDLGTGIPIINSVNREAPIEVQYEPLGTFYEIYEDFKIRKGRVGEIINRYIRTTVGRTRLNREIEEAMKGLWAYVSREMSL